MNSRGLGQWKSSPAGMVKYSTTLSVSSWKDFAGNGNFMQFGGGYQRLLCAM